MLGQKRVFWIIVFLAGVVSQSFSQDKTLWFMDVHPLCNQQNPAVSFNRTVVILSPGVNFSVSNSALTFNTMFNKGTGMQDSLLFWDFDSMDKKLKNINFIQTEATLNLLYAGLKMRNGLYAGFSVSKKGLGYISFPGSFTELRYGNADLEKNSPRTIWLSNYSFNGMIYNELSFGLSKDLTDRFSWGVHLKFLQGKTALKTSRFNASIETANDFSRSKLKTNIKMMVSSHVLSENSGKFSFDATDFSSQFTWPNFTLLNPGMGFDAGFQYRFSERLKFAGSMTDLGFIVWGKNPQQVYSKGEYNFDGLYFSAKNIEDFDVEDYFKAYTDTLRSVFSPLMNDKPFVTGLRTKIYLSAEWQKTRKLTYTGLFKTTVFKNKVMPETTLGVVYEPFRHLLCSVNWSFSNFSFYNFGAGLVYTSKRIQFYAATDNINAINILNSRGFNLAFGINWLIFQELKVRHFGANRIRDGV